MLIKFSGFLIVTYSAVAVTVVLAKFFTFSRTIWMPRSSDALSSRTRDFMRSGPKSSRESARIVDVFPVPGGP